jgi:hypothetical protein
MIGGYSQLTPKLANCGIFTFRRVEVLQMLTADFSIYRIENEFSNAMQYKLFAV